MRREAEYDVAARTRLANMLVKALATSPARMTVPRPATTRDPPPTAPTECRRQLGSPGAVAAYHQVMIPLPPQGS